MGWRVIVVNAHSKLSYKNQALIFRHENGMEKIHISEIGTLMLETTDIMISSGLIASLIENKVKIIFCDKKRIPAGEITPYYGSHDTSKRVAAQIAWSEHVKPRVWTFVIKQKIRNQGLMLAKAGFEEKSRKLLGFANEVTLFDETNREGHAARMYFYTLFGTGFSRDADNDINAALNYGYTLLLSIVTREIVKNGCITQLGLKHTNQFNQFNLASDLMEPFRPLVDELVYNYRKLDFKLLKYRLFELFERQVSFSNQTMYLENAIERYIKKTIQALDADEEERTPEFVFE
ncbi:MAG: type II CRISPR-associated endonuclease Cas1 [Lactobacillales bacterium]|jgi:CRISPR-associated endonuclease Cas1 subtype II|nr:type II CRISPR-associated endonuclease Cas1 [Lactobacillales bacterium]